MQRVGSLDIDQDLEFERWQWTAQRVGWTLFLLIILAGLAGFMGAGPLGRGQAATDAFAVDYDRFVRERASSELQVRLLPGAVADGEVAVSFNQTYLDRVDIERVIPEPHEMATTEGGVIYRFAVENSAEPGEVIFAIQPSDPGQITARIGLADGSDVTFEQFIFP